MPRGSDDGSSMSELSGITNASAKTYITEESSLVIECNEKGVTRLVVHLFTARKKQGLYNKIRKV